MSDTVEAIVRGDLHQAMITYPVAGPLSLLVRAAAIAPIFHADVRVVYLVGTLSLLAEVAAVAIYAHRSVAARSGAVAAAIVAVLTVFTPVTFSALHGDRVGSDFHPPPVHA